MGIRQVIRHALLHPSGAGGGLTSPRGITAARPPFFILRVVARPLGYVAFGDLKSLLCLLEPLGVSWRVLSPLDRLLVSPSPSPGLGATSLEDASFLFSTSFRTSTSLNLTPLNSTHLNSLFDPPRPPFRSQIDPRSAPSRLLTPY